jgi:AraC-like DNA-binding protein
MTEALAQRINAVAELPAVLREMGIDPSGIFAEVGLDVMNVTASSRLPMEHICHLFNRAIAVSRCEHIGLLCGLRFRLEHHGVIGELMRTSPTLWHALVEWVTWQPLYSSSAVVFLQRKPPVVAIGYGIYAPVGQPTRPVYESAIGIGLRMIQQLTGRKILPVEFQLTHRPPADRAVYRQLLKAPVRFNEARSCLILHDDQLRIRLPGADLVAHRRILESILQNGRWVSLDWAGRVRHEIRRALLSGSPGMDAVAEQLGLSGRTLRRRLKDEGTTFDALRDEVRQSAACELLEFTDLSVLDISSALGFASSRVFAESFRRWTTQTPSIWREGVRNDRVQD